MYPWLVFLHVLSALVFLMSHGISAGVSLQLRREQSLERVKALLELSANSYGVMYLSLLLLLISGVVTGLVGRWWAQTWIWLSLGLLIAIAVVMFALTARYYTPLRKAAGLPFMEKGKQQEPLPPASLQEVGRLVTAARPLPMAGVGIIGLLIIMWLMMFKPF